MKLLTHLGLGDQLICYPLSMELSKRYGEVELFCKKHNERTMIDLYEGTDVHPIAVGSEMDAEVIMNKDPYNSLKIGYTSACEMELEFGKEFYRMAGVDYELKKQYKLKRSSTKQDGIDVFIHDTVDYRIDLDGFRPSYEFSESLLSYCELIENAKEVHVIESSFKQLIEYLNPKGKLYLHKFNQKSFRVVSSVHNYTIIEHD